MTFIRCRLMITLLCRLEQFSRPWESNNVLPLYVRNEIVGWGQRVRVLVLRPEGQGEQQLKVVAEKRMSAT